MVCNIVTRLIDYTVDFLRVEEFTPDKPSQWFQISHKLIHHRENQNRVLEIIGMSLREGSRIWLMDYYRGDNQHWDLVHRY